MTVAEVLEQVKALSDAERRELVRLIVATYEDDADRAEAHRIIELAGLGKEIWEGVDVDAYIKALRDEWDARSY